MNILVTGATGFIGKALTASLVSQGHQVAALTRDVKRAASANSAVSAYHSWRAGENPPPEAIAEADVVINLAGESVAGRWSAARKQAILDSRVQGTRQLVEALQRSTSPKTLINASAVGYYGERGEEELTETSAPGTGFLRDVTESWEREALNAESAGHRVVVMRLGIVLGHGGAMAAIMPLFKIGLGGPLGSGRQWWPWVHINDVVSAFAAATANSWHGVYNLTAPEPARQADFARALGRTLGRPSLVRAPAFMLRLIQGEFADEVLFSKRVLPARLLAAGHNFAHPELEGALQDLFGRRRLDASVPARA